MTRDPAILGLSWKLGRGYALTQPTTARVQTDIVRVKNGVRPVWSDPDELKLVA